MIKSSDSIARISRFWFDADLVRLGLNHKNRKMNKFKSTLTSSTASFYNKREPQVSKLLLERQKLPVFAVKNPIIKAVEENETIILIGETGSGKTTQIPQFVFKALIPRTENSAICITQPRR